jgi:hypothetical protein
LPVIKRDKVAKYESNLLASLTEIRLGCKSWQ